MLNPNSKITFTLSPKRKRSRANEPLDVGSPTATGFNGVLGKKNHQSFDKQFIKQNTIGGHTQHSILGARLYLFYIDSNVFKIIQT